MYLFAPMPGEDASSVGASVLQQIPSRRPRLQV